MSEIILTQKEITEKIENLAKILYSVPQRYIDWDDSTEMIRVKQKLYFIDLAGTALNVALETFTTVKKEENK